MKTPTILINDESLPIVIRKHRRARRIVIRYQPLQHHVTLTLPRYASIRQGLHFVEEKRSWIEKRVQEKAAPVPFADGQVIPLLGKNYTLRHTGGRGVVAIQGDHILVPGDAAFMERRVREWLKARAREEIMTLAQRKAAAIGKKCGKISLRDTSSRWGSCSHDGNLSFSWRLIFTPAYVLDYLVSHEVAHLAQHNHSPAFWSLVRELHPGYHQAQSWLSAHGKNLYGYG